MLTPFDSIAVDIAPTLAKDVRFVVLSQINHFESMSWHTAADVTVTNMNAIADVHWQASVSQRELCVRDLSFTYHKYTRPYTTAGASGLQRNAEGRADTAG